MKVAILMGSKSDLTVMEEASAILKQFGVQHEMRIMSAHRTPEEVMAFTKAARDNGFSVIIAGAGMAAHLAGAIAAHTTLPVIAVPIASSPLNGMDSLLAMVQMPPGIPVATVSIGRPGAKNAALLAIEMLSLSSEGLRGKLDQYRSDMRRTVLEEDAGIRNV
ncbi:MAG TPA: 5-(carboxyamino)imidazole ribonucleotide mutase [Deltaproteobacteria bacterium]|nr:5-(carboxyamino)imidazole ribonucleotide mutase [Deltaproteobacteria bacterium]HQI81964.1 5-(carboxyamino)imidazole ribonucleotide mutase [Deltaproteobacteria bacterium]